MTLQLVGRLVAIRGDRDRSVRVELNVETFTLQQEHGFDGAHRFGSESSG
jgi:hypothetical protein